MKDLWDDKYSMYSHLNERNLNEQAVFIQYYLRFYAILTKTYQYISNKLLLTYFEMNCIHYATRVLRNVEN